MNMTGKFNPASENDPKKKLIYGLIALACVLALGLGLDAASCSRASGGDTGDPGQQAAAKADKTDVADAADEPEASDDEGGAKLASSPDPSETCDVNFEGYDKLSGLTAAQRDGFCTSVASTMKSNGYSLDDIIVAIKKKPQKTDNGTVVFMRVKGTDDCYSAHYAQGSWTVFPLLQRVDGVNDDLTQDRISARAGADDGEDATEQSATTPKKAFAITDTSQAAKYIGDACAAAMPDAWRGFAAEKEAGADADSALFSYDHVTQNDDGTITFTVWMPSSQKTYLGTADKAAGTVSFSE